PEEEQGRKPDEMQHKVTITKPFCIGMTEVTQGQWSALIEDNKPWEKKGAARGDNNAASGINWEDANAFCRKLSEKEGKKYRLPTEAEWEYACRAGTKTVYSFGDEAQRLADVAWFNQARENPAHQVGLKRPNAAGLFDMHGNLWEWCSDRYGDKYYESSPADDPLGSAQGDHRVMRGGSFESPSDDCRAARRGHHSRLDRDIFLGFRVVYDLPSVEAPAVKPASTAPTKPTTSSSPATGGTKPSAPGGTAITKKPQGKGGINSVGMPLVLMPAGKFMMGSPVGEEGRSPHEQQHEVTLTKPFYIGATEVTRAQWFAVMQTTPWAPNATAVDRENLPVSHVTWQDSTDFCAKLSAKEKKKYRLPTEAEWEYSCRAGTKTRFYFGEEADRIKDYAWTQDQEGKRSAHEVAQKLPNAAGLYDMLGNQREHCQDRYSEYPKDAVVDPQGRTEGGENDHMVRGGCWGDVANHCRAAERARTHQVLLPYYLGFRVVLEP
ncbi:MAG: formylglycine-generating enzyme family protein, partial [Planctomycetes bacterium]|nr:formylglycine-generating enzyme family protein [Planctomycetota bacterium]